MTTPSETPIHTPCTDAKERESEGCCTSFDGAKMHAHYAWKFARTLERELRALTAPVEREEIDGLVKDAKERIRRSIKLFHNADVEWGIQMIAEFEDGAPEGMTLLNWIDDGIQTLGNALETMAREKWRPVCPDCRNTFLQPFVCVSCGAQKLYDTTLKDAIERAEKAEARLTAIDKAVGMVEPTYFDNDGYVCQNGVAARFVLASDYDALKLSRQKLAGEVATLHITGNEKIEAMMRDLTAANERAARAIAFINTALERVDFVWNKTADHEHAGACQSARIILRQARRALTGESNG